MTKLAKWHVEEILENFVLGGFPVKDDDKFLDGLIGLLNFPKTIWSV